MSQYYITSVESPISVSRINELLKNSGLSGVSSTSQANSKVSELSNKFYKYIFTQKITELKNIYTTGSVTTTTRTPVLSHGRTVFKTTTTVTQTATITNKKPVKFSDFRNSCFVAATVEMIPETKSQYGTRNDGQLKITPYGGTGVGYSISIKSVATGKYIIAEKKFSSGGNAQTQKNLNSGDYIVTVKDLSPQLTVINSYNTTVSVTYGGSATSTVLYLSR